MLLNVFMHSEISLVFRKTVEIHAITLWGHHMMKIGVLALSGKEKEVNQFVSVLYLSFNVITSISLLLGIVICPPVT